MHSRAMAQQRRHVFAGTVTGVTIPTIPGMRSRQIAHESVAMLLGHDRRRGNARLQPIPADDRTRRPAPLVAAPLRGKVAVDQDLGYIDVASLAYSRDRAAHRQHRCIQDVDPVDFFHRGDTQRPATVTCNLGLKLRAPLP